MPKLTYVYQDPESFNSGETPYGTYDSDSTFQTDIVSVTKWVAKRLGYPVLQLEIPSGSIYACFEESINEYSQHINNYNIKNWMWEHYGNTATGTEMSSTGSHQAETPNGGLLKRWLFLCASRRCRQFAVCSVLSAGWRRCGCRRSELSQGIYGGKTTVR